MNESPEIEVIIIDSGTSLRASVSQELPDRTSGRQCSLQSHWPAPAVTAAAVSLRQPEAWVAGASLFVGDCQHWWRNGSDHSGAFGCVRRKAKWM